MLSPYNYSGIAQTAYQTPAGLFQATINGNGYAQGGPLGVSTGRPPVPGFIIGPQNTVDPSGFNPFSPQAGPFNQWGPGSFGAVNPYSPTPYPPPFQQGYTIPGMPPQQQSGSPFGVPFGIPQQQNNYASINLGGINQSAPINFGGLGGMSGGNLGYGVPQGMPQYSSMPQQPGFGSNVIPPWASFQGFPSNPATGQINPFQQTQAGIAASGINHSMLQSPFGTFVTGVGPLGGYANAGIQGAQASGQGFAAVLSPFGSIRYWADPVYANTNFFQQGFFKM